MDAQPSVQTDIEGRCLLDVEVQPNSSRSGVVGFNRWRGTVRLALIAPALRGAANRELVEVIATALSLPDSAVGIISGETSRRKRIRIEGIEADALISRLAELIDGAEGRG